jgi:hypothetical protein
LGKQAQFQVKAPFIIDFIAIAVYPVWASTDTHLDPATEALKDTDVI